MKWITQFRMWLATSGRTQRSIADAYGCTPGYITSVVRGRRQPSPRLQILVQQLSSGKVPAPVISTPLTGLRRNKPRETQKQ